MNQTHTLKALGALTLVAASQAHASQPIAYDMQKLPVNGASSTQALGINKAGQVVGMAQIGATSHAVLWTQGVATDLGAGRANAINAAAHIAGSSVDANGREQATVWTNQAPTLLGDGAAYAINDQDEVVGEALGADGIRHPAVWRQGVLKLLSTQAGRATGINKNGQIVGYVTSTVDGTTTSSPIKWVQDVATVLSAGNAVANGINDAGVAVGVGNGLPVYWTADNQFHTLFTTSTPGALNAINNSNLVVGPVFGTGLILQLPSTTPYISITGYTRSAGNQFYGYGDWYDLYPQAISESGVVAANYCHSDGSGNPPPCSTVVFTPTPANCLVSHSLSTISSLAFSEDIVLVNMTTDSVSTWQVTETLKNATLVYKTSVNAKVKVSGGGVNLVVSPSTAAQNMVYTPRQQYTASFSGAKLASTVPTITSFSATMGGMACIRLN